MAEDLGEVRVNIESEGAEDAAGTIGDAIGEGADDGGRRGGGIGPGGAAFAGAEAGGVLGAITAKLAAILGFVTFLATLKPIQELLSGLQRLFSVAVLPLVALLTTFLRPILQKLLRFIGDLDFNNIVQSLRSAVSEVVSNVVQNVLSQIGLDKNIGGEVGDKAGGLASTFVLGDEDTLSTSLAALSPALFTKNFLEDGKLPIGAAQAQDFVVNVTGFTEQSNTSLQSNAANSNSEQTQRNSPGPQ